MYAGFEQLRGLLRESASIESKEVLGRWLHVVAWVQGLQGGVKAFVVELLLVFGSYDTMEGVSEVGSWGVLISWHDRARLEAQARVHDVGEAGVQIGFVAVDLGSLLVFLNFLCWGLPSLERAFDQ